MIDLEERTSRKEVENHRPKEERGGIIKKKRPRDRN